MKTPKKGERCKRSYDHTLGGGHTTRRTLYGVFWGACRHTSKHWAHFNSEQMGWMHVDGNKHWSQFPLREIEAV